MIFSKKIALDHGPWSWLTPKQFIFTTELPQFFVRLLQFQSDPFKGVQLCLIH
jgi:hypothetical protein